MALICGPIALSMPWMLAEYYGLRGVSAIIGVGSWVWTNETQAAPQIGGNPWSLGAPAILGIGCWVWKNETQATLQIDRIPWSLGYSPL